MDWDAENLPERWKRFRQHVELMFSGPLAAKKEEEKCSYLLIWCGEKGRDIANTWSDVTEDDKKKLETYFERFANHVEPKCNPVFSRYKFHKRVQAESETVEQFVTDLKLLVRDCSFKEPDEMIRDRIVFGTNSRKIREKLINEGKELTLDKAVDIARTYEMSQSQMKSMEAGDEAVHSVNRDQRSRKDPPRPPTEPGQRGTCGRCGKSHAKDSCPAMGKTCLKCKKANHFANMCKTRDQKVHEVSDNPYQVSDSLFVESISEDVNQINQVFVDIEIGHKKIPVSFKLDTGAQVNVIPLHVFHQLECNNLESTTQRLFGYGGKPLKVEGKCTLACSYKGTQGQHHFYVVSTQAPPILGLSSCLSLNLIQLVLSVEEKQGSDTVSQTPGDILTEYKDVFEGLGSFPGVHKIQLKPEVDPVIHPPRKVPIALRDKLEKELERMESLEVIAKVTEPTDWVNSIATPEKQRTGALRVCLDPRDLNQAVKREHYPLPTLEELTLMLSDAKYFSVLDATSGYWQIKLDEESSLLTTFNTPFGRYRFTRMPFGIHSAQEVFQKTMDMAFEGINGCKSIIDDMLVWGSSKEDHDHNLRKVLERTREVGIKWNADKCVFGATEVSYFGHVLSDKGVQPDPKKIAAIQEMEPPRNKQELETLLGMVNYLAKFTPNLAETTSPMRSLLKKDSDFVWDSAQQTAFDKMKQLITSAGTLAYYDVKKEVTLEVDASKHGLGAVLMQEGKPVAYASKSLNPTEQDYAQIEKEMYAIVFGTERFHQYIYGRNVTVTTDHKPLEAILSKPLSAAPARLQRMMLRLQKYDLTVHHKPGKEIPVADTLSRLHLNEVDNTHEAFDAQVHLVVTNLPVSDQKMSDLQACTASDPDMQQLIAVIKEGWPDHRDSCPPAVKPFWNYRDELSVMEGLLFKGERIVIPVALRKDMLKRVHIGHMGMVKCKNRAKEVMFWPGMNSQIEDIVSNCPACTEHQRSNPKEPMIAHELPQRPWQNVATDLFMLENEQYLIVVDYYSRYFELERMSTTTSSAIINKLKAIFARHGIPEKLVSDNGPQFSAQEFAHFANEWDFRHITSSPTYPQSNGLVEKSVHIAKQLLKKSKSDNRDPYLGLLEHRNTPVDNLAAPAQLLMSRSLRSVLPTTSNHLKPNVVDPELAREKMEQKQATQRHYYNQGARELKTLASGEEVHIQTKSGNWRPATVLGQHSTPRSYTVRTKDGNEYRRNRRHLLKSRTPQYTNEETSGDEDRPEASTTSEDRECDNGAESEPIINQRPTANQPAPVMGNEPYTTRSGRVVKPRVILDL